MARGLTDDYTPEEPEVDNKTVLEMVYSLGAYLEQVEAKIDKILHALGLEDDKDSV